MYKIEVTRHFKNQFKHLAKKNRFLKEHLLVILKNFNKEYSTHLGQDIYKLRLRSENKGKSGGYRLYIYIVEISKMLIPIAIHSKSDKEALTVKEILQHITAIKVEIGLKE